MSMETLNPPRDHNRPPLTLPTDEDMLAEMRRKYPEVEKDLGEFETSFATYPQELDLKDGTVASALNDLIDQAKKTRRVWKAHRANEKSPLTKLANIVTNFFTGPEEKLDTLIAKATVTQEDYLQKVKDQKQREHEAELERQRQKEEAARQAVLEEQRKAREAEEAATKKREEERVAREAAEKAKRDREDADRRAAEAREREQREEQERRDRIRAEKERNTAGIRDAKAILKSAERLNQLAEAEEATPAELAALEDQIKPRGQISSLMGPISTSPHLDEDQAAVVSDISVRLQALRSAGEDRLTKKQQRDRETARKAEEREQARLAEQRRQDQAEADARLAAATEARKAEEAAAAKAAQDRRDADAAARTAREEARGHEKDAKTAGRAAGRAGDDADRAANRADRLESRGTGNANVRGDLGSQGLLARTWKRYLDDEEAIRATLGPLGPHINRDAIEAAATHWMRAHQAGFEGERVTPPELPGIRFALEEDLVTR